MLNWKHFLSASLSAFTCLSLLLILILRPTIEGAQAAGEQGVYIDIGMLGDSGESAETRIQNAPKISPKIAEVVEPIVVKKKTLQKVATSIESPLPEISEPIQLAQVEVTSDMLKPVPDAEDKEEPESEVKDESDPEVVNEPEPEVIDDPEPEVIDEPEPEVIEEPELELEVIEKPEALAQIKEEQDAKIDLNNLDREPASELSQEPNTKANDSINQLKMSTGRGISSATTGGATGKTAYANIIKAMIASKNTYPKASRKRGETGTVVIQIKISHLGSLIEVKVIQSSGKKRLDRASIKAVKRAAPFPASSNLAQGEFFISRMPIEYALH